MASSDSWAAGWHVRRFYGVVPLPKTLEHALELVLRAILVGYLDAIQSRCGAPGEFADSAVRV